MKYGIITIIIFSIYSCNSPNDIQNEVDSLAPKVENSYKPGLGEFMSSIQVHHNKLWFAGKNQNWKLADFEVNEIKEEVNNIKKYCTDRQEIKSLPMIEPELETINRAIQ